MLLAYALLAAVVTTTAAAQLLFKHYHLSGRRASLAAALLLFASLPPATYYAVRQLGIGRVYILTSLSYGIVAFLGARLFGERVTRAQVQGLVLIVAGCLVYNL